MSLDSQRDRLTQVKSKNAQMFNSLGMSDSIVTLIERRSKGDIIIFIVLCIFTLLLIYVLITYVK